MKQIWKKSHNLKDIIKRRAGKICGYIEKIRTQNKLVWHYLDGSERKKNNFGNVFLKSRIYKEEIKRK